MAGNREGAKKARDKNLERDPNFYSNIGKKSWQDPNRTHVTGFALLPPEERAAKGRKGGEKTKNDYKKKIAIKTEVSFYQDEEEALAFLQQTLRDSSDLCE